MFDIKEIIDLMISPKDKDINLISRAFSFAQKEHEGQTRDSGKPYFSHVFDVSKQLASLKMDASVISAGLLHDILEDSNIDETTLRKKFGREVTFLVKGVTKLDKYHYQGLERHAESLRKLLLAVSKDIRVLIIKITDRLHNMKTLEYVDKDKRKRIALETLEIYAPLANRLGMSEIRGELEDLAFPYVYPKKYIETKKLMKQRIVVTKKYIKKINRQLQKALVKEKMEDFTTLYRIKHLYSLYKKLPKKNMDINKIYDIYALRVIVPTVADCYRVLGIIHSQWKPLLDHIKDYIALPKPNGYQSLHTTIFTGDGGIVEIQIRTKEMHEEAQYGIATHFAYKEKKFFGGLSFKKGQKLKKKLDWMGQLIEWQKSISESGEFLESLKMDFFKDRVFIFTPKGDVIDLPEDSTSVDFAYAIHSDIGNHIYGTQINEKFSSLDTVLHSGDRVEILTRVKSKPSKKWLTHVKTALARRHINSMLAKN